MDAVLETLFAAVQEVAGEGLSSKRTIFLGGQYHPALRLFDSNSLTIQQHFKPYETLLKREGFEVSPAAPDERRGEFDLALVLIPKNMVEARRVAAQAVLMLRPGGLIICAADNKAGGQRLAGMLQKFGIEDVQQISKSRARAALGICAHIDAAAVSEAFAAGAPQKIAEGHFNSQPGLFAWDRVDRGSEILVQFLPKGLEGVCGDFGCGYGYLSRSLLETSPHLREIICADADYRALKMCEQNLYGFSGRKRFVWEDLSREVKSLHDLDCIVMNPPFHEGKKTEADIGRGFIAAARAALRPGGQLYVVANKHLPYEDLLRELFSKSEKLYEGDGYKIYLAQR